MRTKIYLVSLVAGGKHTQTPSVCLFYACSIIPVWIYVYPRKRKTFNQKRLNESPRIKISSIIIRI